MQQRKDELSWLASADWTYRGPGITVRDASMPDGMGRGVGFTEEDTGWEKVNEDGPTETETEIGETEKESGRMLLVGEEETGLIMVEVWGLWAPLEFRSLDNAKGVK